MPQFVTDLPTPCLVLEKSKLESNIERMAERIAHLGGALRPHVKTHKSIDVANKVIAGGFVKGITVSTLREAEYFFERGISDIMYAVGVSPNKLKRVRELMVAGCDLKIVLDNKRMAEIVAKEGEAHRVEYNVLIELDTDGHRSGVNPESDELINIGSTLAQSTGAKLVGVMTHAGESYGCQTPEALLEISQRERDLSVLAAERLRGLGIECQMVSIGSTPTALSVDNLNGVTEVRAGVYVFFDLVMAGVGVCDPDDVAVSVLSSIIGYQEDKGWAITDGGWMALSRDRGTSNQFEDYGYGKVVGAHGESIGDLAVIGANQEHGIVGSRIGNSPLNLNNLPIGGLVRVLPNHACATAGQYDKYYLVDGDRVLATWPRVNGW